MSFRMSFCTKSYLLLVPLGVLMSSLWAQNTSATFRTSAKLVLVPVTVTDHNGKAIEGLRAQNFTVYDEKRSQQILSFANEDVPCSVGLVLDISGSMRNILSATKDVVHAFLQTANPDDEFLLLTVSTEPNAMSGFTTDVATLEESIRFAKPGGFTALIDTLYLGLSSMRRAGQPRRALLILSDGVDNHSRYSKSELIRVALEADVQVYTIVFYNPGAAASGTLPFPPGLVRKPWDQARENQGPEMLAELSARTGGLHFVARKDAEAKEFAVKAGRAIRNEYVIGYQRQQPATSGKWHKIRVKSDAPGTNVYARRGYYER